MIRSVNKWQNLNEPSAIRSITVVYYYTPLHPTDLLHSYLLFFTAWVYETPVRPSGALDTGDWRWGFWLTYSMAIYYLFTISKAANVSDTSILLWSIVLWLKWIHRVFFFCTQCHLLSSYKSQQWRRRRWALVAITLIRCSNKDPCIDITVDTRANYILLSIYWWITEIYKFSNTNNSQYWLFSREEDK